jgi:hypothetical protein
MNCGVTGFSDTHTLLPVCCGQAWARATAEVARSGPNADHQPRIDRATRQVARRVPQLCFEQSTSPHPDRVPQLRGEVVDEIRQPYLRARVSLPPAFMLRVSAPSMAIGVVPAPQPRQPCPSVVCSGQLLGEGPEDFFGRSSKRIRRHGQPPPSVERTHAASLRSSVLGPAETTAQLGSSVRATSVSRRLAGDTAGAEPTPEREQVRSAAPLTHRLPSRTARCGGVSEAPRVRAPPEEGHVRIGQRDPNSPVSVNFRAISVSFTLSP